MMKTLYNPSAPKKPANLSVNSDLLNQAKNLNINLSQVLEHGLAVQVKQRRREQWLAENRAALDAYNKHIERDGLFGDSLRSF